MEKFIVYHPPEGAPDPGVRAFIEARKGEMFSSHGDLDSAIKQAKATGFHLLVTPYYRSTMLPLHRAGVVFTCVDQPDICDLTVGAILEVEGKGMKPPKPDPREGKAVDTAERYRGEIETSIYDYGCYNLHQIAQDFARRKVLTARGKTEWHTSQIQRYVKALKIDLAAIREQANGT